MRAILLVIGLAACGRFRFGAHDSDARTSDAPFDASPDAHADARPMVDTPDGFIGLTTGFDYTDFTSCPPELVMIGSAGCVGGQLEVTPSTTNTTGIIWTSLPYVVTSTTQFSMTLAIQFGNNSPITADGMAIVFQADPRGTAATGVQGGGYLGYDTIAPSTALELDTFQNVTMGFTDPDANHLGFDRDGSLDSVSVMDPTFTISDGNLFFVWLDYDGASTTLSAFTSQTNGKPSTPLLSITEDLTRLGDHAWIGLTASTGADYEQHHVLSWRLDVTP